MRHEKGRHASVNVIQSAKFDVVLFSLTP